MEVVAPAIGVDALPYGFIGAMQQRFEENIYNPLVQPGVTDVLLAERDRWAVQGKTTVFTSGVYDLLHLDHAGYLLHTKATGAAVHYTKEGHIKPWEALSSEDQQRYTAQALGNGALRLIVSVDGDKSVAVRKSGKAGGPRPIYAWHTRALMVASQTFINPVGNPQQRILPIADAVTIHGPEDFPAGDTHASHLDLVARLQPDAWAIFGESTDILEAAPHHPSLGAVALRCINDGADTHYFEDANMGKMSTTKIVERIVGN